MAVPMSSEGIVTVSYKTYRDTYRNTYIKYRNTYRLWKKCIVTPLVFRVLISLTRKLDCQINNLYKFT